MKNEIMTDAMLEVTNIGAGQAATALSRILQKKVLINVPNLTLMPIEEIPQALGGSDSQIIGVYFGIEGDLSGRILLVFSHESGHRLASLIMGGSEPEGKELTEMSKSAMMEMGNIITNSYLNGLAGLLDITLFPTVPYFAEDMLGAVVDTLLIEIAMAADKALLINTEISIENENLKGSFLVFPDEAFMKSILERLDLLGS